MRTPIIAFAVLLLLNACDEDPVTTPDTGLPDAGLPDAEQFYDSPAPPVFTPCPAGWREHRADGVTTCEPWPETGRQDCPLGEAHFPGEPGCRPIGTPCPEGFWPADLSGDHVLYIYPEAPGGGDGTQEHPFRTIGEALAAAPSGATLALARGLYQEVLEITRPVTLVGFCAAETVIEAHGRNPDSPTVAITVDSGEVELRDLQITGERQGLEVSAGRVWLRGVLIHEPLSVGLLLRAGTMVLGQDVVIRGARATLRGYLVDNEGEPLLDSNRERFDVLGNGDGVVVLGGALLELDRAVIADHERQGLYADGIGTTVDLARTFFGDITPLGVGALDAEYGAQVTCVSTVVERVRGIAIMSLDEGSLVLLQDVIVRDTDSTEPDRSTVRLDGQDGRGLGAFTGGTIEARRLVVEGSRDVGLLVSDQNSRLFASDVVVRDTRSRLPDGASGRGLVNQVGGRVVIERALFVRNRESGIYCLGPDTTIDLVDVEVRETLPRGCIEDWCAEAGGGVGVGSYGGGHLEARRFRVSDSSLCGVQLAPSDTYPISSTMDLHDGEVTRNPIGVNNQCEEFDLTRLEDRVIYPHNGRNLDSRFLPVPDPI